MAVDNDGPPLPKKTDLHAAAARGDGESIRKAVAGGAYDLQEIDIEGYTALHLAAANDHPTVVSLLVNLGADVTARDPTGCTPLSLAARRGRARVVETLLKSAVDPLSDSHRIPSDGALPLHLAARANAAAVVRVLVNNNEAGVLRRTHAQHTPLHEAVLHHSHDALLELLSCDTAKKHALECTPTTPFGLALETVDATALKSFLAEGALTSEAGWGEGHEAAYRGKLPPDDCNLTEGDLHGYTPIHLAAALGHTSLLSTLFSRASLMKVTRVRKLVDKLFAALGSEMQSKHLSECQGEVEELQDELLWDHKGLHNIASGENGRVPLHLAVLNGHVSTVSLLLEGGADRDFPDKRGWTPLHFAAACHKHTAAKEIADLLLTRGADGYAATVDRETPLMLAAKFGNVKVVQYLLESKVVPGAFELASAVVKDSIEVLKLLVDKVHPAEVTRPLEAFAGSSWRNGVLGLALWTGRLGAVEVLLRTNPTLNPNMVVDVARSKMTTPVRRLQVMYFLLQYTSPTPAAAIYVAQHHDPRMLSFILKGDGSLINRAADTAEHGVVTPLQAALLDAPKHKDPTAFIAAMLEQHGAAPSIGGVGALAPIEIAAGLENEALVRLLIHHGALVDEAEFLTEEGGVERRRISPLLAAVEGGHTGITRLLLRKGADVEYMTPLLRASQVGQWDIARLLVSHGASPNVYGATDDLGPLHYAMKGARSQPVQGFLNAILEEFTPPTDHRASLPPTSRTVRSHRKMTLTKLQEVRATGFVAYQVAASAEHRSVVKVLLATPSSLGAKAVDKHCGFNIENAAAQGSEAVVSTITHLGPSLKALVFVDSSVRAKAVLEELSWRTATKTGGEYQRVVVVYRGEDPRTFDCVY